MYCTVNIVAASMCLSALVQSNSPLDGFVIGLLAIAAFFGLFTFAMTGTSVRYACENLTNVDYIKAKTLVHQLAIRVPLGTPPGVNYGIINYPLPKAKPNATESSPTPSSSVPTRTFAIVRSEKGENPFDLGTYRNWKSIMGNNVLDWFLPFNPSPCETYENSTSFYEMGPLYQELRSRYGLPDLPKSETGGVEMAELETR